MALSQNGINAVTSSSGWTSFTTNITGSVTNPTFGTVATNQSSYLQIGKLLFINYLFVTSSIGSSVGSGNYLFSIPSGFTINTTITGIFNVNTQNITYPSVGYSIVSNGTAADNTGVGTVSVNDSTHYILVVGNNDASQGNPRVGSTWFQATGVVMYSASLILPIL